MKTYDSDKVQKAQSYFAVSLIKVDFPIQNDYILQRNSMWIVLYIKDEKMRRVLLRPLQRSLKQALVSGRTLTKKPRSTHAALSPQFKTPFQVSHYSISTEGRMRIGRAKEIVRKALFLADLSAVTRCDRKTENALDSLNSEALTYLELILKVGSTDDIINIFERCFSLAQFISFSDTDKYNMIRFAPCLIRNMKNTSNVYQSFIQRIMKLQPHTRNNIPDDLSILNRYAIYEDFDKLSDANQKIFILALYKLKETNMGQYALHNKLLYLEDYILLPIETQTYLSENYFQQIDSELGLSADHEEWLDKLLFFGPLNFKTLLEFTPEAQIGILKLFKSDPDAMKDFLNNRIFTLDDYAGLSVARHEDFRSHLNKDSKTYYGGSKKYADITRLVDKYRQLFIDLSDEQPGCYKVGC